MKFEDVKILMKKRDFQIGIRGGLYTSMNQLVSAFRRVKDDTP